MYGLFDEVYDAIFKGKIFLTAGAICVPTGIIAMIGGAILMVDIGSSAFLIWGILLVLGGVYSLYHYKHFKERITRNMYEQILTVKNFEAMCEKSGRYLSELKNDKDYFFLKELFDRLPRLYNEYAMAILDTPLQLSRPVSAYTAAFWGTKIGGVAVGMVAAQDAIEQQKAYEENVKNVLASNLSKGNAYDKVNYCYVTIESIIEKRECTRVDWECQKSAVKRALDSKYKVMG